jgi:hypothetical protein
MCSCHITGDDVFGATKEITNATTIPKATLISKVTVAIMCPNNDLSSH